MLIGGFYLFSFLWNSLKRRNIEWNCPSGQRVSHKLLNNRFTERREKSWIWCASCWKYIKRYGTMIGLFELHSRQRARQSQTCSDLTLLSVWLWRKCRRHEGAERLMFSRPEEGGSNQYHKQHWMKLWSALPVWRRLKKEKRGRWKRKKRAVTPSQPRERDYQSTYLCTSTTHFLHCLFFPSISSSTQTCPSVGV